MSKNKVPEGKFASCWSTGVPDTAFVLGEGERIRPSWLWVFGRDLGRTEGRGSQVDEDSVGDRPLGRRRLSVRRRDPESRQDVLVGRVTDPDEPTPDNL